MARRDHHQQLVEDLAQRLARISDGGGPAARERHLKRGKLPARDRIGLLFDIGSPFMELSALAADGVYEGAVASAGIVCGIGLVHGQPVMVVANDATVRGGSYFPLTGKKHLRAQEIAAENRLPCVYLVDSGGANLSMQDEIFPDRDHFGAIFYNQARMSAAGLPQIAVVLGSCTAGGAYVPAMADETIIVEGNGTIFLAGPPLVKAATGEEVSAQALGGAAMHATVSGLVDHRVFTEAEALARCRDILRSQPLRPLRQPERQATPPARDDLFDLLPEDLKIPYDVRGVIGNLCDAESFLEFKAEHGETLVCGIGAIEGHQVGTLANNGVLYAESARKAAHFIGLCEQRRIPLLFLHNIAGFMVGETYERGGITRDGAKMVAAVSTASVPKISVIIGGSYGAGNYGMCGRAYRPRFLFTWPNSRIAVMGGESAAETMATVKRQAAEGKGEEVSEADMEALKQPILEQFERQSSPYYATARLWDDGVIDPRDTRRILAMALAVCWRTPDPAPRSVVRM